MTSAFSLTSLVVLLPQIQIPMHIRPCCGATEGRRFIATGLARLDLPCGLSCLLFWCCQCAWAQLPGRLLAEGPDLDVPAGLLRRVATPEWSSSTRTGVAPRHPKRKWGARTRMLASAGPHVLCNHSKRPRPAMLEASRLVSARKTNPTIRCYWRLHTGLSSMRCVSFGRAQSRRSLHSGCKDAARAVRRVDRANRHLASCGEVTPSTQPDERSPGSSFRGFFRLGWGSHEPGSGWARHRGDPRWTLTQQRVCSGADREPGYSGQGGWASAPLIVVGAGRWSLFGLATCVPRASLC
jgi:hypothetical protein